MSRWLTCAICGQRKPVGIMSAQAWRTVNGASVTVHACPECQQKHVDWQSQLEQLSAGSSYAAMRSSSGLTVSASSSNVPHSTSSTGTP